MLGTDRGEVGFAIRKGSRRLCYCLLQVYKKSSFWKSFMKTTKFSGISFCLFIYYYYFLGSGEEVCEKFSSVLIAYICVYFFCLCMVVVRMFLLWCLLNQYFVEAERVSRHRVILIAAADSSEGLQPPIRRCFSHEISMTSLSEEQRSSMISETLRGFSKVSNEVLFWECVNSVCDILKWQVGL